MLISRNLNLPKCKFVGSRLVESESKCLFAEMPISRNVNLPKCKFDEMSFISTNQNFGELPIRLIDISAN